MTCILYIVLCGDLMIGMSSYNVHVIGVTNPTLLSMLCAPICRNISGQSRGLSLLDDDLWNVLIASRISKESSPCLHLLILVYRCSSPGQLHYRGVLLGLYWPVVSVRSKPIRGLGHFSHFSWNYCLQLHFAHLPANLGG